MLSRNHKHNVAEIDIFIDKNSETKTREELEESHIKNLEDFIQEA